MIKDIFYILNYPAWFVLFFIIISLVVSVILRIKVEIGLIKIGLFFLIMSVLIISFNYEPSVQTDLYRYFDTLDTMRETGSGFYNSHEIVSAFLFKIVSKTSYNNLLPFIAALIRYCVFFIVFIKYIYSGNYTSFSIRMFLIFNLGFFPIIEAISGVRYYLAITFIFASILYSLKFDKRFQEVVYGLLGLFTHTSSIIYIGLRVLVIEKVYKIIKPFRWLIIFWPLFIEQMALILKSINTKLTQAAARMLIFYSEETREISARLTIARVFILLLLIGMFYYIKIRDKETLKRTEKYYRYLELVLMFALGSIKYAVFFQRSIFFLALVGLPIMTDYFTSENISKNKKNFVALLIIFISLAMMANQIYGFLAGYF